MALRKLLFSNPTEGFAEEFNSLDDLDLRSGQIKNLATPTLGSDAANKTYVDSVATGLDVKYSCRVKTTEDFSTYTSAGSGVGKTLTSADDNVAHNTQDGVLMAVGNRVLVTTAGGSDATPDSDNGIYTVTTLADGAGQELVLTRAIDADQDAEVTAGMFTFVTEGTANADTGWVLVTDDTITVDTTALRFSVFSTTTVYTFDQGLSLTSGSVKVELDTAADAQGAGAGGGSSGLEFDVNTASGKLRAAVSATRAINRFADGLGIEVDPLANTAGNNPTDSVTATGLAALRAPKVEENYIVNEAIAVADAVDWSTSVNDRLVKSRADTDAKSRVIGVARTAGGTAGNTIGVVMSGVAAGVLTGATVGTPYYLQPTGGISPTVPGATNRIIQVGIAKNATDLFVRVVDYGKKT